MYIEKLNKKSGGGVYVIEEEQTVTDGAYEGYLEHDSVTDNSISVYTGPGLTGQEITNCMISTPADMTWKTYIKVYANDGTIYITYETTGDMVEAEDINRLQEDITDYMETGLIDGGNFIREEV